MQHLPVHWTEGLFMTAQHFQAADRHWQELLSLSSSFDAGYNYGLHRAPFSGAAHEAITNESFQLNACQARTRQGTVLSFESGSEPDRISLAKELRPGALQAPLGQLTEQQKVRVYLAVPKLRLGNANAAPRGAGDLHRYVIVGPLEIQDEHRGGNRQEIELKTERLRLLAKVVPNTKNLAELAAIDDDPDFELVPLGQIKRLGEKGPELDESYIPPLLDVSCWQPLQVGILQFIYDRIGNRIQRLADRLQSSDANITSQEPSEIGQLMLLRVLNEASASLKILAFARGVHPLTVYAELVRIVGRLSIFGKDLRPPADIPPYDHDNLGYIFAWIRDRIAEFAVYNDDAPQSRPFVGRKLGMQVMLDEEWMGTNYKWYVGVHYESGTAANCKQLLQPNFLFWKMGSLRQVDKLFQLGMPGLHLVPLETQPPRLPKHNWIYFEVSKAGAAWLDVVATQTLAMRYKDALVANKDSLENEKTLIISVPPNNYQLQFVLYAVPTRA
jgi:type VI secretion system protein ImpJ